MLGTKNWNLKFFLACRRCLEIFSYVCAASWATPCRESLERSKNRCNVELFFCWTLDKGTPGKSICYSRAQRKLCNCLLRALSFPWPSVTWEITTMKGVTPCSNNISNSTVTFFYQGPGTGLTPIEATGKPEKAPEANLLNGDRCESNYYGPLCYCN